MTKPTFTRIRNFLYKHLGLIGYLILSIVLLITIAKVQGNIDAVQKARKERLVSQDATNALFCEGQNAQNKALGDAIRRGYKQTLKLNVPGFGDAQKEQSRRDSNALLRTLPLLNCKTLPPFVGVPQKLIPKPKSHA